MHITKYLHVKVGHSWRQHASQCSVTCRLTDICLSEHALASAGEKLAAAGIVLPNEGSMPVKDEPQPWECSCNAVSKNTDRTYLQHLTGALLIGGCMLSFRQQHDVPLPSSLVLPPSAVTQSSNIGKINGVLWALHHTAPAGSAAKLAAHLRAVPRMQMHAKFDQQRVQALDACNIRNPEKTFATVKVCSSGTSARRI